MSYHRPQGSFSLFIFIPPDVFMFSWYDHIFVCIKLTRPVYPKIKRCYNFFLGWNSVRCSSEILFFPLVDLIGLTSGLVNQCNHFRSWHVDLIVPIFVVDNRPKKVLKTKVFVDFVRSQVSSSPSSGGLNGHVRHTETMVKSKSHYHHDQQPFCFLFHNFSGLT